MKNPTTASANREIVSSPLSPLFAPYWKQIQENLRAFPEATIPTPLTEGLCRLAKILEVVRIEEQVDAPIARPPGKRGRSQIDRQPLARAFLAKAVLDLASTRQLIEQLQSNLSLRRLCGMTQVPSEATFSRAFARFAHQNLGDSVHQILVEKFVSPEIVMHVSQDSTASMVAVEAREKAIKKGKLPPPAPPAGLKKAWSSS